jgi:hypothetical protein
VCARAKEKSKKTIKIESLLKPNTAITIPPPSRLEDLTGDIKRPHEEMQKDCKPSIGFINSPVNPH